MSSSVPCAPSNMIDWPARIASVSSSDTSRTIGRRRSPCASSSSSTGLPVHRGVLDQPVARGDVLAHVLLEPLRIGQIADANAAAPDLVLVGRTDAARRRADLPLAAARFGQQVELAVIRQDQVRLVADQQPVADVDADPRQLVDFGEQRLRIDDDAVADDAGDAGMQDAGRDQVQDELLAVDVHRVAGVVAALIPRDDGKVRRQQVDDLAFAFIAPLRAENGRFIVVVVSRDSQSVRHVTEAVRYLTHDDSTA